jgi:hypothetical protein
MAGRLDRVVVATSRGQVEVPWGSRDMLLERLDRVPSAASITAAFEAVGASRPVHLSIEQEVELHEVVQQWVNEVGARNLPPGILDLRHTLKDEDATAD